MDQACLPMQKGVPLHPELSKIKVTKECKYVTSKLHYKQTKYCVIFHAEGFSGK